MRQFKRRLVTIVSGDIVGYSRLMGVDDEFTLSLLKIRRDTIERYVNQTNGRIFGVAGDCFMAEFVSPIEAVRFAADVQAEIEKLNEPVPEINRIRYRLGLHLGDVIADGDDLFGDAVNIAARLQAVGKPGHIIVSDAVFVHVKGMVDVEFEPLGVLHLKNIRTPIVGHSANANKRLKPDHIDPPLSIVDLSQPVPGFGERPAVAVVPFSIAGSSEDTIFIADGLADDIIAGLMQMRWLPVISRHTSFRLRNTALDAQGMGRAIGAGYLVTGRMSFSGGDLRLAVNLEDSETGHSLWGQKYNLPFSDLLDVQDEITSGIVCALHTQIDRAEQHRSYKRKPEDLDTWQLTRRGNWHLHMLTKDDAAKAHQFFTAALARDPDSIEAHIHMAWWYFWDVWSQRGDHSGLFQMEKHARRAMRIDGLDGRGPMLLGISQLMMSKPELGRTFLMEAIQLNPNLTSAHATIGSTYILSGQPEKAIEPILLAVRLDPHNLYMFHFLGELAVAFYMTSEWGKAIEFAERSLQLRPGYWYAKAVLIASLARTGRLDKAHRLIDDKFATFSTKQIKWLPFTDKKWNEYLVEGLALAGYQFRDVG